MAEDLQGQVALVTGVSRRAGIGYAIARRLLDDGASVFCHSWSAHDVEQPWGADALGIDGVIASLDAPDRVGHLELDLAEATNAERLVESANTRFGHVDALIANHARSSSQSLTSLTAEELDRTWAVNARASVLLVQAFAAHHDDHRADGRVILFTSGQHRDPMPTELPYAISKGAIHQMTLSLSDALASRGIKVNTVDPGPTDTGWASPELLTRTRFRHPEEIADVVAWLLSQDTRELTGQVLDLEGGFS